MARWIPSDRLLNPPCIPWDLSVVLVALTEKLYESLRLVPRKLLTLKVLFLIVVASTHWVSELHVLCIDYPFIIANPLSFILAPNPAFQPKMATEVTRDQPVTVLPPYVLSVHFCEFIFAASNVLGGRGGGVNRSLFVPWDDTKAHRSVSKL